MKTINYDSDSVFYPWVYMGRHFSTLSQETVWQDKAVHVIIGMCELIPGINYIVAIFDQIFGSEVPAAPTQNFDFDPPLPKTVECKSNSELISAFKSLGIVTQEDFSEKLGGQLTHLSTYGVKTQQDLDVLLGKSIAVTVGVLRKFDSFANRHEARTYLIDTIESLEPVLKELQLVTLVDIYEPTNLQAIYQELLDFRGTKLSVQIKPSEFIKFKEIMTKLIAEDQKRQIGWIKGYLTQDRIAPYWKQQNGSGITTLSQLCEVMKPPVEKMFHLNDDVTLN